MRKNKKPIFYEIFFFLFFKKKNSENQFHKTCRLLKTYHKIKKGDLDKKHVYKPRKIIYKTKSISFGFQKNSVVF